MQSPFPLVVLLALASIAKTQTYVVDDDGGPGVHFTDLPTAVATVPAGAILRVREGTYAGFSVSNKSLTILGDHRILVEIQSPVTFEQVTTGREIVVRDVTLTNGPLTVRDVASPVLLERVFAYDWLPLRNPLVILETCPIVTMIGCEFTGLEVHDSAVSMTDCFSGGTDGVQAIGGGLPGTPGGRLTNARVLLHRTEFLGGRGGAATCCGIPAGGPGGPGGAGLVTTNSTLFLYRGSAVRGGDGGASNAYFPGGAGGNGVELLQGSTLDREGTYPVAGLGSPAGLPVLNSNSTITGDDHSTPAHALLIGWPQVGYTVVMQLEAQPGSQALLLVARNANHVPLEPLLPGSLLLTPLVIVGPFFVPASGVLDVPFPVTSGTTPDELWLGQFLTLEPVTSALWATNPFTFLVTS